MTYTQSSARVASIAATIYGLVFVVVLGRSTGLSPFLVVDFLATWLVVWLPLFLLSKGYRRLKRNPRLESTCVILVFWGVLVVFGGLLLVWQLRR